VEDAGVMYLSLPYYKGFKVYIDGNEVETLKVGGAMLGAQIEEGTHEIEIRYFTYGLKPAIIISLVGLLFAVIIFVRCTKGRKEDGEKE
jgi:uncharacterized membrane protein YfhO